MRASKRGLASLFLISFGSIVLSAQTARSQSGPGQPLAILPDGTMVVSAKGAAYVSLDHGQTYFRSDAGTGLFFEQISGQLFVTPKGKLFACSNIFLYRSVSKIPGIRWEVVAKGKAGGCALGWSETGDDLLAVIGGNVLTSSDGGKTFVDQHKTTAIGPRALAIASRPAKGRSPAKIVWLGISQDGSIARSDNGGKDFAKVYAGQAAGHPTIVPFRGAVFAGPFDRGGELATIARSEDGGSTWRDLDFHYQAGAGGGSLQVLDGDLTVIAAGVRTRLRRVGNTDQLNHMRLGREDLRLPAVVGEQVGATYLSYSNNRGVRLAGPETLSASAEGVTYKYRSAPRSLTRQSAGGDPVDISEGKTMPPADLAALAAQKDLVIVARTDHNVCSTSDGGLKWLCTALPTASATSLAIVEAQGQKKVLAGTPVGALVSDDDGKSWTPMKNADGTTFDSPIAAMEDVRVSGHPVIVAGGPSGLFAWDDKGWTRLRDGIVTGIYRLQASKVLVLTATSGAIEVTGADALVVKDPVAKGLARPSGGGVAPLVRCNVHAGIKSLLGKDGKRSALLCDDSSGLDPDRYEYLIDHFRHVDDGIHAETGSGFDVFPLKEVERGRLLVASGPWQKTSSNEGAPYELFLSSDNGAEWTAHGSLNVAQIERIAIAGPNQFNLTFFEATPCCGPQPSLQRLKLSPEGFPSVAALNPSSSTCASPSGQSDVLFCLKDNGAEIYNQVEVQRSGDAGASYKSMGRIRGRGIVVSPSDPKRIFAGGYFSADGGWTWKPGLPGRPDWSADRVNAVAVKPDGRPVFTAPVGDSSAVMEVGLASLDYTAPSQLVTMRISSEYGNDTSVTAEVRDGVLAITSRSGVAICALADIGQRPAKITARDVTIADAACAALPSPPGGAARGHLLASRAIPGAYYLGVRGQGMLYLGPGEKDWRRMEAF